MTDVLDRNPPVDNRSKIIPGSDDRSEYFNNPEELVKDPLGFVSKMIVKHGLISKIPCTNSILVADADLLERMLITDEHIFSKSEETMAKISPAIGSGLSTLVGDKWKRQRKIANPSFSKKSVELFGAVFNECIDEMMERWQRLNLEEVDVTAEMKNLTLRIVIKCLFSTDVIRFTSNITESLEVLQEYSVNNLWAPHLIDSIQQTKYENAKESIDKIIYSIISERRLDQSVKRQDLLSMYMDAIYEDTGESMGDTQLRHEIMNLFLAGHETTANGVAFALYLLATHQEYQSGLRDEIRKVLADRDQVTIGDLKIMDLNDRVFKESLRLYPSSWGMSRVGLEEFKYNGYVFPEGADYIVAQWGFHRHPKYWTNPLSFDPDRFLPERMKAVHKYAYLPFGAGARKCIGVHLAEIEGQTIIARIVNRYSVTRANDQEPKLKARLFMTAEPGIKLKLKLL